MSQLTWYWHRLRAMSPGEIARHARKKFRQWTDARHERDWAAFALECSGAFPRLPPPEQAPDILRQALRRDADDILAGRWQAFGHLDLQVDDPPKWQCDYLAGRDLATNASAFKLNHRDLPEGVDIKLIWELSRWYQLVRLAMAAYVLDDERAARKCVAWLEDWVRHNPPYRGWNWTSALESGLRLAQFTWIDALLSAWSGRHTATSEAQHHDPASSQSVSPPQEPGSSGRQSAPSPRQKGLSLLTSAATLESRMETLRHAVLPPHVWFTWRHQSFGSSANNHLIGELAGLILATARWPALAHWSAPLDELQRRWEREVLAQFAEDGGNREQALNYHLFSWEFCWQAMTALCAGRGIVSPEVSERLYAAADFFVKVQVEHDHWNYGDSDDAFVLPLFANPARATSEWWQWLISRPHSPAIEFWMGQTREGVRSDASRLTQIEQPGLGSHRKGCLLQGPPLDPAAAWLAYPQTGQATCRAGQWMLRWDCSPLGYLRTAAHGHLDALHLSIWFKGVALVIDPGTGCYYADERLRAWLASRQAHNGPCPAGLDYPKRLGPFLWSEHHPEPVLQGKHHAAIGELTLPGCVVSRRVSLIEDGQRWQVEDSCAMTGIRSGEFTVLWQFAPGAWVKRLGERRFALHRAEVSATIEVGPEWTAVELVEPLPGQDQILPMNGRDGFHSVPDLARENGDAVERVPTHGPATGSLEGLVSPAFRSICRAPFLKLTAGPSDKPCVFRTTFLASLPP